MKKRIAILGSTGSIGQQTLDVISSNPSSFEVELLTANNNADLLIEQAIRFQPNAVVIANVDLYSYLKQSLSGHPIKIFAGKEAIAQAVTLPSIDIVLTAMVGYSGLIPTINAIKSGKHIALANKETLVVAGELIVELAKQHRISILPVDSEHSAIFQCLQGEHHSAVEKIILTASGGPFRNASLQSMVQATKKEALNHPSWTMGAKITIDSATMMNKGLEIIEAYWLFGVGQQQIEVLIHPQSVIHSMVQFTDGSIKAQMGVPDMKVPIQYALSYPKRLESNFERLDFKRFSTLTFEQPDEEKFPALHLAFHAMQEGGNMPCIMNAANEAAVEAFLNDRIRFMDIPRLVEQAMLRLPFLKKPSIDDLHQTHSETLYFTQTNI